MNIKQKFDASSVQIVEPDLSALSRHSIVEARDKEMRLMEFYEDPYGDGSERWFLAQKTYEYARAYKKEGSKRKNKFQENILHEQNIAFLFKALVQSGILPRRVTYEIVDGKRRAIPKELQSAEHVFSVVHFHDIDEDFPDSSPEEMGQFLTMMISDERGFTDLERHTRLKSVMHYPDMMRAVTFGRKVRDANKKPKTIETHDGDPQIFLDELEKNWATGLTKGGDRLRGVVDRYGPVPYVFTLEQQKKYLSETEDLFYFRQFLETMQARYPELKEAFAVINARLNIAYRSMRAMVSFHPDNKESLDRKSGNPLTARLDIANFLPTALKIQDYVDDDADDMSDLLVNLEYVSARRPTLRGITRQLREQMAVIMPAMTSVPRFYAEAPPLAPALEA